MNWKGWWALETERAIFGRRRHPGVVSYTIEHKKLTRKRKILLPIVDAQPLKGASDFEEVTASLKRRPDTKSASFFGA